MVCNAVDVTGVNFIGIGKIMLDTQKTVPYKIYHIYIVFSHRKRMAIDIVNNLAHIHTPFLPDSLGSR